MPDVGVLATRAPNKIMIMVWHYHDDDIPGPDAMMTIDVAGLPASLSGATLTDYRIDQYHSNPYAEWVYMGSPVAPNPEQYAALQKSSQLTKLAETPTSVAVNQGAVKYSFNLPRQAVSLLVVEW